MQVKVVTSDEEVYSGTFIKKNDIFIIIRSSETKKILCIKKASVKSYSEKKRDGSYEEQDLR